MLKGLRHVGLVVKDVEKALYFYRDLLGFSIFKDAFEKGQFIEDVLGVPGVQVRTIKMRGGNEALLELLHFDKGSISSGVNGLRSQGYTHIALTVGNIGQLCEQLSKESVFFISQPKVSPDGKAKVAFCRDFEGNYVELVEEIS